MEQFKSLTNVRCNLVGHDISQKDEDRLYDPKNKDKELLDAKCERCHTPLIIKIDPKDSEYYLISEKQYD